jgi:hypothetical protein
MTDPFSAAQIVGYFAFALGLTSIAQKSDGRLKAFNAMQSCCYAIHFVMLGNLPAGTTAGISTIRSLLAMRTRSPLVAGVIVAANLAAGFAVGATGLGWLPVAAGCAATITLFLLRGITMRLALLCCTLAWLVNNWLSGSIGGVALETLMVIINTSTMIRMLRDRTVREAADDEAPPVT